MCVCLRVRARKLVRAFSKLCVGARGHVNDRHIGSGISCAVIVLSLRRHLDCDNDGCDDDL